MIVGHERYMGGVDTMQLDIPSTSPTTTHTIYLVHFGYLQPPEGGAHHVYIYTTPTEVICSKLSAASAGDLPGDLEYFGTGVE